MYHRAENTPDRAQTGGVRRWRTLLGLAAVANLVAVGLVAAPSQAQAQPSLCSGTAQGLTISGDLAVPAGQACELIDTTVTGSVVVRADATLLLDGSTVQGDLTLRAEAFASALDSTVGGATILRQAFGAVLDGSELAGGADARNSGFLFSDGTSYGAEVFSRNGETVIQSGRVDGNVRTNLDLLTDLRDTVVTGGVNVNQAAFGSLVCESEIDGQAAFRNSNDLIQIGGGPILGCEFNVFGAGLALRDNDAIISVGGNVIRGDLACTGNSTEPSGSDNRVRGQSTGQCADLTAAGAAALRGAAPADADARVADVVAQIERRTAEAEASVAVAGKADL